MTIVAGPISVAAPVTSAWIARSTLLGVDLKLRQARRMGGTASIRFEPGGLVCVVEAPIDEVSTPAEVVQFPRVGWLRQA